MNPRLASCDAASHLAPVAQLDRASVYGTEGQRFESSRARAGMPWLSRTRGLALRYAPRLGARLVLSGCRVSVPLVSAYRTAVSPTYRDRPRYLLGRYWERGCQLERGAAGGHSQPRRHAVRVQF